MSLIQVSEISKVHYKQNEGSPLLASQQRHFLTGGVFWTKFEHSLSKTPFPPACGSDPFGLDDFKFFFGGKFFLQFCFDTFNKLISISACFNIN